MDTSLDGKTVVITGATSGIGQVAAEKLAAMGGRIVLVARDKARSEATVERLRNIAPGVKHSVHYADLSSMAQTRRVAGEITSAEPRIDVLINNAGAIFARRHQTEEGLERTFALNHMSYFLMAAGLRERLVATPRARIVNVASGAHRSGHIDFSDLQRTKSYQTFAVYGTTKLCNILFTRELARRLAGTGVTANCLHPGFVATRFGNQSGGFYSLGVRIAKLGAISEDKGAATTVYLASSSNVADASGEYFYECARATPSREAQDDKLATKLWAESEKLAGA